MSFIVTFKYHDDIVYRPAGYGRTADELSCIVQHFVRLAEVTDIHIEETMVRLPFKIFTP